MSEPLSGRIEHNLAHDTGIVPHGILHPVDLLEGVPGGGDLLPGHVVPGGNLVDVLLQWVGNLAFDIIIGVVVLAILGRK